MELDEFITKTLIDVVRGVRGANSNLDNSSDKFQLRAGEDVSFDVAVTISEKSDTSRGGSIKIYAVNLGGEKGASNINESVTRIKFKIKPNNSMV